jgi:anthranilate synthase/aminodeoxychorismate synthase-like glutamine amidotransferase
MFLVIDNYDSFVYNLARYFEQLGQSTIVRRNDAISLSLVESLGPSAIVLSPGPRHPMDAGCCIDIVRQFQARFPILGVCLGHQAIAAALGGRVVRARQPMHGRASLVRHNGRGVFWQLPNPLRAGRYHSLVVDPRSIPDCLEVTATTEDGIVMAVQHRSHAVAGLQFHPESILTESGHAMLRNFLVSANVIVDNRPILMGEKTGPWKPQPIDNRHTHPVNF